MKQDEQVINQQPSVLPVPNGERSRTVTGEVPGLGNNNLAESRKFDHVLGTICKHLAVSNIGRKRHFGEVDAGLGSGPIPLVVERNVGLPCKEKFSGFQEIQLDQGFQNYYSKSGFGMLSVCQTMLHLRMNKSMVANCSKHKLWEVP
jgi:hypothetical protein